MYYTVIFYRHFGGRTYTAEPKLPEHVARAVYAEEEERARAHSRPHRIKLRAPDGTVVRQWPAA